MNEKQKFYTVKIRLNSEEVRRIALTRCPRWTSWIPEPIAKKLVKQVQKAYPHLKDELEKMKKAREIVNDAFRKFDAEFDKSDQYKELMRQEKLISKLREECLIARTSGRREFALRQLKEAGITGFDFNSFGDIRPVDKNSEVSCTD